jgi:hydroxymethylbilane synthase
MPIRTSAKEIEEALIAGSVHVAVHSAKDMQTFLPAGLSIGACLAREDVRDALVARSADSLESLPPGARVGTASLRREALLRRARPDLTIGLLRGNVPTRLARVVAGEFDATLLAAAGLRRLGLDEHVSAMLPLEKFPPACGQGALAIECRADDRTVRDLLAAIDHHPTSTAIECERAFLAALDGSCRSPIAGHARADGESLRFDGILLSEDGSEFYEASTTGAVADAAAIGRRAGEAIRRRAPASFLERLGIR